MTVSLKPRFHMGRLILHTDDVKSNTACYGGRHTEAPIAAHLHHLRFLLEETEKKIELRLETKKCVELRVRNHIKLLAIGK